MGKGIMILPIGAGVIGQDDVPLVRIMDSDETPTTITVYGVVDTVQPVTGVTWTVNGVEQSGDVSRSPVLELTNLQPETSYAITLRATNVNGESSASTRTIMTKKITTVTPSSVLDGVSYYNLDVYYTGNIPTKDENDIVVNGRDVTVPTGYYAESETVSISSEYIIPTGTKNITDNGNEDVTQYANVNVQVPASAVVSGTKNITNNGTEDVTNYASVDVNVQPSLYSPSNVTPTTSQQTIGIPQGYDGLSSVTVNGVTSAIDPNITSGNIKDGVTILGVQGNYDPSPNLGTLQVTPSTNAQMILPSNVDGWDEVDVSAVTSSIDNNITAGNIKKDVTILGVTGTLEQGIQPTGTLNIVNNGTYDITNYANVTVQVASGDFNELCFTAEEANCTVGMTHLGTNQTTTKPLMYYSTDNKQTWTSWDGSNITLANVGDKMYVYGDNLDGFNYSSNDRSNFVTSGRVAASGNVMSLITRYGDREYIPNNVCFYYLFSGTTITTAPELPATTLTNQCYQSMFSSCTNLTTPPSVLPATSLATACYQSMFKGCTSLTTAPALPATALADNCYNNMFYGCTSLTTAPSVLPSTTLASNCYQEMFQNCTSLTTAPELPATALPQYCYNRMFSGCTSLTTAPALPATTLGTSCYNQMFKGCTQLNKITIYADSWNTGWTSNWVNNVSGSGTFIKPNALQTGTGSGQIPLNSTNGIPTGWTVYEIPSVVSDDNEYITLGISSGYDIYYTTDGSTPTTSSTLYTAPIDATAIGDTFTLKIISYDGNGFVSPVNDYKFIRMPYIEALENNTVLNTSNWAPRYSSDPIKVQYSTDKANWNNIARNQNTLSLANTGDRVYIRKASVSGDTWGQGNVTTNSGTIKAAGCLEYALYWDITGNRPAAAGCDNLFQNCTGLTDASDLVLVGTYYQSMFNGCTNLTAIPALPATILVNNAYKEMFRGCTSLTTTPELPATTLASGCYQQMFRECTSLISVPSELPATTLKSSCYQYMFYNCTSLTTAPELPATTLASYCYNSMFYGCTSLTTPPELPATASAESCYMSMFENCTSLIVAPELVITDPQKRCYEKMFKGCTSLSLIKVNATTWNSTGTGWLDNTSTEWVNNVAASGTFIKPTELVIGTGSGQIPSDSPNGIPTGWTTVDGNMLRFTAEQANSTVALTPASGLNLTLYKSTDGVNFTSWDGSAVTLSNIGDTLWVYGNNQTITVAASENYYTYFVMTGSISAAGDATYLFQNGGLSTLPNNYAMCSLFKNCTSLTVAPDLPSTTLTERCYLSMFNGCTNLVTGPSVLPATSVPSTAYQMMFKGCTSLVDAPVLSATTVSGSSYAYMFEGCTNLVTAPALPALSVSGGITYYGMFKDCSSLVNAPSLPATTLSTQCYMRMFQNCTSLVNAPTLQAPSLSALECYCEMFNGCTSLNNITCLATSITGTDATSNWLLNVAATGTFTKDSSMSSWTTGADGIPTGWTVVDA